MVYENDYVIINIHVESNGNVDIWLFFGLKNDHFVRFILIEKKHQTEISKDTLPENYLL